MKCKNCKNLTKRIDSDGILYDSCEIIVDCPDTERERDCKYYTAATNADRIRAMTDEELAEFMALNTDCYYCRAKDNDRCASLATTPCGDIWLDWLKQEANIWMKHCYRR